MAATAWNTKADGTGTSYTDLSTYKVMGPDVIVYAQWEPRDGYTIHYNPNGGNLSTVTQSHGFWRRKAEVDRRG